MHEWKFGVFVISFLFLFPAEDSGSFGCYQFVKDVSSLQRVPRTEC